MRSGLSGMVVATALAACAALSGPAAAQEKPKDCGSSSQATAATPPAAGPSSGTAPGGMGSSGWSGGTGGSTIGTNPQGAAPGSPTQHPETARGLDPTKPGAPATTC